MARPNLDTFAEDAVVFENAYVSVAWCSPSRTAILTSRRPDTSMTWSVTPAEYWRVRGGNFTTLPQYFKERGYLTLGIVSFFVIELERSAKRDWWLPNRENTDRVPRSALVTEGLAGEVAAVCCY